MKLFVILGIIVLVIAVLVAAFFIIKQKIKDNIMDGPGMIYEAAVDNVYYYYGGGMLGSVERYELTIEGATITIHSEICEANGCDTTEKTCIVDESILSEIEEVIWNNTMFNWKDLKKSDIEVLDAPSTSFSIHFTNGNNISVGDRDELPNGGWQAIDNIKEIMKKAIESGEEVTDSAETTADITESNE